MVNIMGKSKRLSLLNEKSETNIEWPLQVKNRHSISDILCTVFNQLTFAIILINAGS